MAEFERIFSKFSTAEELTGAAGDDDDEDDDAAADREGGDGALVKVRRAMDCARIKACGPAGFGVGLPLICISATACANSVMLCM